jgi:hypothetical protein
MPISCHRDLVDTEQKGNSHLTASRVEQSFEGIRVDDIVQTWFEREWINPGDGCYRTDN